MIAEIKKTISQATKLIFIMTLICGVAYTGLITGIGQLLFPHQANGSIIQTNGVNQGCELLAQNFEDEKHMWGRVMNISILTFQNEEKSVLMYAEPSNLSPNSDRLKEKVEHRVAMILAANPDAVPSKIPVDLVTCSGSGLDPDISMAAAQYQVPRIAKNNGMSEEQVQLIIEKCTHKKAFDLFGEETVNVLKVNLMLEGILE